MFYLLLADDHSRVKLRGLPAGQSDYINANYIDVSWSLIIGEYMNIHVNVVQKIQLDFENYILVIFVSLLKTWTFFFAFQGFKKKKAYIATQGKSHFLFLQMQCSYVVFLYINFSHCVQYLPRSVIDMFLKCFGNKDFGGVFFKVKE